MLVLYDVLGEVGSSERHPNAFRVSDAVHPIRLKDVQAACPFEYCHFSFQHDNGVYGSYTNPNSVVPVVNRSRIHAKIVVSEGPAPHEKGVRHDDAIHVEVSNGVTRSTSRTSSSSSHSGTQRNASKDPNTDKAPWEATFGDNPSRDSSGGSNSSRGDGGGGGLSAAEIKEKFKKQTDMAKDFAKNLHVDDMKRNAVEFAKTINLDETARKAKKWGGSLLTSISNSISSASNAMSKGEVVSVGTAGAISATQVHIVRLLAEGAYGHVFLVKTTATNETCVLKRIVVTSAQVERDAAIERQVLENVQHPHIMRMLQYGETRSASKHEVLFLLPFYDHGTLWDSIWRATNDVADQVWPFNERRSLRIFQGIAAGVAALHAAGFAHRDLKPHNVLLDHRDHSILMDFGSCAPLVTEIVDRRTLMDVQDDANRKCSAPYRAPELFEPEIGHVINGQSDVWSLGCLLYCMAFGSSPFESAREVRAKVMINIYLLHVCISNACIYRDSCDWPVSTAK
ncbi:NAK protein kinase, variant 1 [Aphanomyces astaci]|uniref:NAK protein kinase, variant 1 n=1 Tax=Aphanomyces astaci TaxID=112090 RepID=W4GTJ8_APHAT|nr:NAK protein kinase, variant 1 [Aphanomyces astaci]ETV82218.1 NAK protein kinase, variant 1 [Aphanomyces astaci]|eukprot:XP_009827887.1 NAK protein kinase, variant 1 [Aphanomyces astaci]